VLTNHGDVAVVGRQSASTLRVTSVDGGVLLVDEGLTPIPPC
jgi:hypothetical protein